MTKQTRREALADILETVAKDGLPNPRDLDVALDAIYEAFEALEVTHKHLKTGKLVEYLAEGRHTETEERLVAYRCEQGGIWFRPTEMFHDGRFEDLDPENITKAKTNDETTTVGDNRPN